MNQCELVANYIHEHGSITTHEAYFELGITRLASRIHDLAEAGYSFKKESVKVPTRYGGKATVTRYRFNEGSNDES